MLLSSSGGLSDAGGSGSIPASAPTLPYATSRGFTSPTDIGRPTIPTNAPTLTREIKAPSSPISGGGVLPAGGTGDGTGAGSTGDGSTFDKLLGALGSLSGSSGGGGGGSILGSGSVPVATTSSSGPSMTRLLIYGGVGVAIYFLGKKMGWW